MTPVAGAAGNRAGWPVGAVPTDVGARELGGVDSISDPSDQGETAWSWRLSVHIDRDLRRPEVGRLIDADGLPGSSRSRAWLG